MSTQPPKSIGEAINDFTEDDVPGVADEAADNTDVGEGTAEGAEEDEASEEESSEEEGEEDEESDEGEFPDGQPTDDEDEDEGEGEEEDKDEDEEDIIDALTPEDIAVIKGSPELTKVRKLLLRGYNKKMEGKGQQLRLVEAYEKDPIGILQAMAKSHGLMLNQPAPPQEAPPEPDKISEVRAKVEKLFGAAGPNVRETLDEYWEVLNNQKLGPVQETLGRVLSDNETSRMRLAETEWRSRHKEVLTKRLIDEVVALGNSGRYVPGDNVSPGEYLDDLLTIAKAKDSGLETKEAKRSASKNLARRIKKNKMKREPGGVSSKAKVQPLSKLITNPEQFQSLGDAIQFADEELSQED